MLCVSCRCDSSNPYAAQILENSHESPFEHRLCRPFLRHWPFPPPPAPKTLPVVVISENDRTYTLDNGIVKAIVAKESGDLVSLKYKDLEMLATFEGADGLPDLNRDPPGENLAGLNRGMTDHQYGFWSHDAMGARATAADNPTIKKITIDPKTNGGAARRGFHQRRFQRARDWAPDRAPSERATSSPTSKSATRWGVAIRASTLPARSTIRPPMPPRASPRPAAAASSPICSTG